QRRRGSIEDRPFPFEEELAEEVDLLLAHVRLVFARHIVRRDRFSGLFENFDVVGHRGRHSCLSTLPAAAGACLSDLRRIPATLAFALGAPIGGGKSTHKRQSMPRASRTKIKPGLTAAPPSPATSPPRR